MTEKRRNILMLRWGLIGFLAFALFWGSWYLIAGHIPVTTTYSPYSFSMPFELTHGMSRMFDIFFAPIWSTIIIYLYAKFRNNFWFLKADLVGGLITGLTFGLLTALMTEIGLSLVLGILLGALGGFAEGMSEDKHKPPGPLINTCLGICLSIGLIQGLAFGLVAVLYPGLALALSFVLGIGLRAILNVLQDWAAARRDADDKS